MTQKTAAIVERYSCSECLAIFRSGYARCPLCGAAVDVLTDGDPLVGRVLDRYRIEHCVGEGGMGRVYRAKHVYTGKEHAIKVLFGDHAADPKMRERMRQEAMAVGRLSHRNVIAITDAAETEDNSFYLIMDYVDGENLANLIQREAPFSQERVIDLMKQLCLGLGHAHDNGLVHRDFKSENVLVANDADGELAKIVDFGIAVVLEAAQSGHKLTTEGMVLGTPAFMAPEQATGAKVDHRSDLFSLGVLMYEMLSGKLPFDGTPLDIARQNLVAPVPRFSERVPGLIVDPRLEDVAFALMAKQPEDRYQSAHEVLHALDGISSGLIRHTSHSEIEDPEMYGSTEIPALGVGQASGPHHARPTSEEPSSPGERVQHIGYERSDRFGGVTGEGAALPRVTEARSDPGYPEPRRSKAGLWLAVLVVLLAVGGAAGYYALDLGDRSKGAVASGGAGQSPPEDGTETAEPRGVQPTDDEIEIEGTDEGGGDSATEAQDDETLAKAGGQNGDGQESTGSKKDDETKGKQPDDETGADTGSTQKSAAQRRRDKRAAERRRKALAERRARERREREEKRRRAQEDKRRREEAERKRKEAEEAAKRKAAAAAAKSDDFEAYQRLYRQVGELLDRAGLPPQHRLVKTYLDINYQSGIMNASLRVKYVKRLKGIRYRVRKLRK